MIYTVKHYEYDEDYEDYEDDDPLEYFVEAEKRPTIEAVVKALFLNCHPKDRIEIKSLDVIKI